ncbi:hypothetical protein [Streptomyces chryseus]|uniref:Uncharacterized protein n=1 Tax=Streptomyces chryseus TaxID=68186 RepID=A0ABQ3DCL7_9ACTN|nr:hypothetical protein [Streptomyces chryseus]GHA82519.1 hypothetical protein GCM10010346_00900 [Streptomyces chryseus]
MSSPESAREHPRDREAGETALDVSTGRVGRVMGHVGPRYQLRPLNGGQEWEADPDSLKAAYQSDALSAAVVTANTSQRIRERM